MTTISRTTSSASMPSTPPLTTPNYSRCVASSEQKSRSYLVSLINTSIHNHRLFLLSKYKAYPIQKSFLAKYSLKPTTKAQSGKPYKTFIIYSSKIGTLYKLYPSKKSSLSSKLIIPKTTTSRKTNGSGLKRDPMKTISDKQFISTNQEKKHLLN